VTSYSLVEPAYSVFRRGEKPERGKK